MELSLSRRLLYSAISIVLCAALLEGGARLLYHPDDTTVYDEHRNIIDVLGLSELNETMVFDPVLFWKLKSNLREKRVSGRVRDVDIDFMVSTNSLGLRSPEPRRDRPAFRVLAVGNSCTFGLGVNDGETWPARLEEAMNRSVGGGVEVINAGVPGYTSYQGRKYLETAGLDLEPDLVIICFGFNDTEVWGSRSDEETGRLLRVRNLGGALRGSLFYRALAHLLHREGGECETAAEEELTDPKNLEKRARVSSQELHANFVAMKEMCAARGAAAIFLLWPYRNQVLEEMGDLIIFQPIVTATGEESDTPVINLYEPFRDAPADPFLDHIHATPAGCTLVAETIAAILERARVR